MFKATTACMILVSQASEVSCFRVVIQSALLNEWYSLRCIAFSGGFVVSWQTLVVPGLEQSFRFRGSFDRDQLWKKCRLVSRSRGATVPD